MSGDSLPRVVDLAQRRGHANLNDIPAQLRDLALRIEQGLLPAIMAAAVVITDKDHPPAVFAFGEGSDNNYQVAGALSAAVQAALSVA